MLCYVITRRKGILPFQSLSLIDKYIYTALVIVEELGGTLSGAKASFSVKEEAFGHLPAANCAGSLMCFLIFSHSRRIV